MRLRRSACILQQNRMQNVRLSVQQRAIKPPIPRTGRPPLVAIVDDDQAVCGSLKFVLELEGFVVRAFGSAAELLAAGEVGGYDCLVVDQAMPGLNGMELIANLRSKKVTTPAILLVSDLNAALSTRAAAANIPVIEKPLFGNALIDGIRRACRRE
ncbi:MAG: response regulator [Xanthobacteraceae bacterium]|nr:response regulator [Xanthobacteraceae bacterium]